MANRQLKNRIEYLFFLLMVGLARTLPRRASLNLGKTLGRFARHFQSKRVATARTNLQHAFPEMESK